MNSLRSAMRRRRKFKRPTTGGLDNGPHATSDKIVGNTEETLSR
jgi:hypothetical protein